MAAHDAAQPDAAPDPVPGAANSGSSGTQQPKVILQTDEAGNTTEPYEDAVVDVDEAYVGAVVSEAERPGATTVPPAARTE